jgi:magnesium-transporting ATPase (P-type)
VVTCQPPAFTTTPLSRFALQNPAEEFGLAYSRTPSPQQIEAQQKKQAHASSGSKVKVLANIGIIVTGAALTHILGDDDCEHALLTVARCCKAVVACRVSPQQKANIVKMVCTSSRAF